MKIYVTLPNQEKNRNLKGSNVLTKNTVSTVLFCFYFLTKIFSYCVLICSNTNMFPGIKNLQL